MEGLLPTGLPHLVSPNTTKSVLDVTVFVCYVTAYDLHGSFYLIEIEMNVVFSKDIKIIVKTGSVFFLKKYLAVQIM